MNPFEIVFGKEPKSFIAREEFDTIMHSFVDSTSQCYLITGVRGTGKTVLLSQLSNYYEKDKEWVVININPEKDILTSLVAKIYSKAKVSHLFRSKTLNIGAHGISVSLQNGQPIVDAENILEIMLSEIKKQKKKLLITIDEITNSKDVRVFAHTFQSMIRKNYPVYLLMTGLPDHLYNLQNEKTLTFLYRAPKIFLNKLNSTSIYNSYLEVFNDENMCKKMTEMVNGYAYAYQLLGMLVYDNKSNLNEKSIKKFDARLAENSYSKIWSELGNTDKKIIRAIIKTGGYTSQIMKETNMKKEQYSVYRQRLIEKGYVDGSEYGRLTINLPRFDLFIKKYDF